METNQTSNGSGFYSDSGRYQRTAKGQNKIIVRLVLCYRSIAGIFQNLNKNLAIHVTIKFLFLLFLAIGVSAFLAFIVTAKWYMVLAGFVTLGGGWFVLYKFEEGRLNRSI